MDSSLNAEIKLEESGPQAPRSFPAETIRGALQKILTSRTFRAAKGQKKFLAYTVEQMLSGRAPILKEYVIATEALGREASFDPRLDPIVRTEARKLRARLAKYYATEGAGDPLRVELRKGSYVPVFEAAVEPAAETPSQAKEAERPPITRAAEAPLIPAAVIARAAPQRKGVFALFASLVLAVSSAAIFYLSHTRAQSTIFAANEASITVLPLVNLSDSGQDFLSDGLTDELI